MCETVARMEGAELPIFESISIFLATEAFSRIEGAKRPIFESISNFLAT